MLSKSRYKNTLTPAKLTALLKKIRVVSTQKPSRFQLKREGKLQRGGKELASFVIDETLDTGTITITTNNPADAELGTKASRAIQDLTFSSLGLGTDENEISVEYEAHTAAVAAIAGLATTTPIVLTASVAGIARNAKTITLQVLAAAANPTDTVLAAFTGTAAAIVLTITPNDGTNNAATPVNLTTAELVALINTGLVSGKTITLTDGAGLRTLQTGTGGGAANLADAGEGDGLVGTFSGGAEAIGLAGSEVVTVTAKAIKVKLQSGVSTATQVKAKLDAKAEFLALATVAISGTPGTAQTAPVGPMLLQNASNVSVFDKADILDIRRLRTKKYQIVVKAGSVPAV